MNSRLLIVDDDDFYQSLTQELLEQSGYQVETAADGLLAWELLDRDPFRFDLILLDKQMPRMDGIALLKRIKADHRFDGMPVIMLTGANSQEDIIEGLAAGAYYYLTKPAAEDVLRLVIKNILGELRQKRELRESAGQQKNTLCLLRRAEFSFRTIAEAQKLALLLADISMDAARTLNGYLELLVNAVEHGNLGISYDEKGRLLREERWEKEVNARLLAPEYAGYSVAVTLEKTTSEFVVTITDQGAGFDWQSYIEFNPARAFDLHGRGIAMSRVLSFDRLEYQGKGNSVKATVLLRQPE